MNDPSIVRMIYVNHKGRRAERRIRPIRMWFGSTAWHPTPQWFMEAFDIDKMETRDFAMANIESWM